MYNDALDAVDSYFRATTKRSAAGFKDYCLNSSAYADVFICDGYRLCRAAKLLMSLGYGNFSVVVQYDIYAMAEKYFSEKKSWTVDSFQASKYALDLTHFESGSIINSPNLSLLLLLAYHKICNDHYRNEKWQPFEPWTCNVDYLSPTDNMNAKSFISSSTFNTSMSSILDLENSNLPIDYFTSVLPRAQYGDESVVSVGMNNADATLIVNDAADTSKGVLFGGSSYTPNDTLLRANVAPTPSHGYRDW